jgi:hypothetical protein
MNAKQRAVERSKKRGALVEALQKNSNGPLTASELKRRTVTTAPPRGVAKAITRRLLDGMAGVTIVDDSKGNPWFSWTGKRKEPASASKSSREAIFVK